MEYKRNDSEKSQGLPWTFGLIFLDPHDVDISTTILSKMYMYSEMPQNEELLAIIDCCRNIC
jgi:hypothetical protein